MPISIKALALLGLLIAAFVSPKGDHVYLYGQLDSKSYRSFYIVAFLFLTWMTLSLIWTPASISLGINHITHFAIILLPLFIVNRVPKGFFDRVYCILPWIVLASSVLFLLKGLGFDWCIPDFLSAYKHYKGNKSVAISCATAIGAGVCLIDAVLSKKMFRSYKLYISLFVFVVFSFESISRVSMLILIGSLVLAAFFLVIKKRLARVVIVLLMLFGVSFSVFNNDAVVSKFERVGETLIEEQEETYDARVELYTLTWQLIKDRNWMHQLIGEGVGSWNVRYPFVAEGYYTQDMKTPHNDFLQVLMQNGIIGLIIFILVFVFFVRVIVMSCQGYEIPIFVIFTIALMTLFHAGIRDTKLASSLVILLMISISANLKKQ